MGTVARTCCLLCLVLLALARAELPRGVENTQSPSDQPLPPLASLAKITVPAGFRVTLFAGEPDVYQPIAIDFDARGRLWVAECFSYPDWNTVGQDRILIFEDADGDGTFDRRTTFAEGLSNITGIALGFGGVFACATPHLVFIPDADGDDRADGAPIVKLDGWNDRRKEVGHNVFNGMTWGPDGWMYGAHGILADSLVGKPGTPDSERVRLNCGIWRFHPVTEKFEVVAHGTTNPWGIDFNEVGDGFFTNCVIGHLWHLIPGARYERMYGTHFNPYTFALIDACSDHLHWGGGSWQDSRGGKGVHGEAGGGHAHVGAMIYLGGTWPREYHGSLFTCNLHGNRLNRDEPRRRGSGYVATHAPDFLYGNDPWLRGISVKLGPDGNVYLSDWTDLGECHDNDGTHRGSGRIYKIIHDGAADRAEEPRPLNLRRQSNVELVSLQAHPNAWHRRMARQILHERAAVGDDLRDAKEMLRQQFSSSSSTDLLRLRCAWTLTLVGGVNRKLAHAWLFDANEHIQAWAVKYLSEQDEVSPETRELLVKVASATASPKLRLAITSAMDRLPRHDRWELAEALLGNWPPDEDPNLPAMVWFVTEPLADDDPQRFARLSLLRQDNPQLGNFRGFVMRRLVSDPHNADSLGLAISVIAAAQPVAQVDMLSGLVAALAGTRQLAAPLGWASLASLLAETRNDELAKLSAELSVKFGDQRTIERLKAIARSTAQDPEQRGRAMEVLTQNRIAGTLELLLSLLADPAVRGATIQKLKEFNDASVSGRLLDLFDTFDRDEQQSAISTLVSSPSHAHALLDAVAAGRVDATVIRPLHAVEINQLGDARLRSRLRDLWGDLRSSSSEKRQQIADWKAELTPELLGKADLVRGAQLYEQNCGKCHRLFGRGGDIGPELTGSDRRNLDYILQNVITPAAAVGKDYRLQTVRLTDGRSVSGALREQTATAVVVQTAETKVTIPRDEIVAIKVTQLSLMPEGQFDALSREQVRDLVGYLGSE